MTKVIELSFEKNNFETFDLLAQDYGAAIDKYTKKNNPNYNFNRFMAGQVRLREIIEYCGTDRMKLTSDEKINPFVISDWIFYTSLITDLVKILFEHFNLNLLEVYSGNVFNMVESSIVKKIDIDYLYYLRSICVAHPLDTNRHKKKGFQTRNESSYYISKMNPAVFLSIESDNRIHDHKYPIASSYYVKISNSDYIDRDQKEIEIREYYKEMIENNKISEEEIVAQTESLSSGPSKYIVFHPNEFINYLSALNSAMSNIIYIIENKIVV